jgi:putative spermidine/putrescine transport system permease protein
VPGTQSARAPVARKRRGAEERPPSLALGVPLLVVAAVLLFWPLLVLARRSLEREDGGLGLDNYASVLTNGDYITSFLVTGALAAASTALALLACVPAALYIERERTRTSQALAIALTIPLSLPGIVIGFFVILFFGTTGLVPVLSEQATGTSYGRWAYTFFGLLLGYLYFNIPRVILTVRGAVAELSTEVIDAARTLGASPVYVYRHVIIPTLRPAIASASALALATAFGAFGTAATLSRGFRVVPLDIAASFTERFQPAIASTLSVLLACVTTLLLVLVSRAGQRRRTA